MGSDKGAQFGFNGTLILEVVWCAFQLPLVKHSPLICKVNHNYTHHVTCILPSYPYAHHAHHLA